MMIETTQTIVGMITVSDIYNQALFYTFFDLSLVCSQYTSALV